MLAVRKLLAPVRSQLAAVLFATTLAACTGASAGNPTAVPDFSIQPIRSGATPSPLMEVRAGSVHAAVPNSWEARPLIGDRVAREGFVAAPKLTDWERQKGTVGMEAFWVDIAENRIPSDYYYLAARGPALSSITENKSCRQSSQKVLVDRPPDLTGRRFSPSDYVASGTATCRSGRHATHWAYLVAAPGFGPVRQVGIRTSGLYVVVVAVGGGTPRRLLGEIIDSTRFGDASVPQIVKAAQRIT